MAVEYSEIMAGAAMFYTNKELDFYTKDADSLLEWLKDAYKTISSEDNVVYGANRQAFLNYVDQGKFANLQKLSEDAKKKYLTNAALSAAAIIPVAGQAVSGGKLAGKIIPKAIKNSKAAQGGGKIAKATKKVKDLAPYLMSTSNEADKYTGYVPAEKTSKEPKMAI